jgi:SAM-dependent methyltransferase
MDGCNEIPFLMRLAPPTEIKGFGCLLEGYQNYQALIAALDTGICDYLGEKGQSDKEELAKETGINGMFIRPFLATLVDIGVLTVEDGVYANTKAATEFLVSSSAFFQGDQLRTVGKGQWNKLSEAIRRKEPKLNGFSSGPSGAFINALAQRSLQGELQTIVRTITQWDGFHNAKRVLDLGGGHGLYTIALCQENPYLHGLVFDKPHIIETTQRYISQYKMDNRITAKGGDICIDTFGSGYDIVLISHLLYKFRKNLEPIFNKVYDALKPGGLLVTNHWFCAPGCKPGSHGVEELAKALQSFGHPLCHVEEFGALFEKKGFRVIASSDVPTPYGNSRLHLAVKDQDLPCKRTAEERACCCRS